MKHWRRFRNVVVGLLRELADESAYDRHLKAHGREACGAEWRRFSDERLRQKYSRVKCC